MSGTVVAFKRKGEDTMRKFGGMSLKEIDDFYRERKQQLRWQLENLEHERKMILRQERGKDGDLGEGLEIHLKALSPKTRETYKSELRRADIHFDGREVDDDALAEYALWRFEELKTAPATIKLGMSALVWREEKLGNPSPYGPKSKSAMTYVNRKGRKRGRGTVDPLLRDDIENIQGYLEAHDSLWSIRDSAMISLGFDAALRISELAAVQVEHIAKGRDGRYRLCIPSSKTDQDGKGHHVRLQRFTRVLIGIWQERSGINEGPLFRRINGPHIGDKPMTSNAVRNTIKKRAKQVGITGRVSGHSLRRGCAQQMSMDGIPDHVISHHCRWKSSAMLIRYTDGQTALDATLDRFYD